jgi:nicotinic acid mononucleotide adenylyltransferase
VSERGLEAIWNALDPAGPSTIEWVRPVPGPRVVVLLGAFDPPTKAHMAIARAASRHEGAPAAFCMTRVLLARPDDELLDPVDRLSLLDDLAAANGWGLVVANRGRYLDVSRALHALGIDATFVIGSDKLAQLVDTSFYPDGAAGVAATFDEVRLLVVPRTAAPIERSGVRSLRTAEVFSDEQEMSISATEVRRRLREGRGIGDLVPPGVASALGGYTSAG